MRMMKTRRWIGIFAAVAVIGSGVAADVRAQVVIANHGFESPALSPGGFTQSVPLGWTLVAGSSTEVGVFYPTISQWNYVAPSGNQVLYLNTATVEQQIATNVVQGEHYLLAVNVVRRPGFWNPNYRIDFFAGSVLLGSDLGTLVPANGGALVSLIEYTAGPGDPAIGQPLKIRLGGLTQTNFDNVRIFVPEPGVGTTVLGILPVALLARHRARRSHLAP